MVAPHNLCKCHQGVLLVPHEYKALKFVVEGFRGPLLVLPPHSSLFEIGMLCMWRYFDCSSLHNVILVDGCNLRPARL